MSTRRERFREYMARLRPEENPARAIAEGFYVQRPNGAAVDEITARLELEPRSVHLVVGGIGSGKTTQLLMTEAELNRVEDVRAVYIDVSEIHDISQMKPGVLVVVAGVVLTQRFGGIESMDAHEAMMKFAHGHINRIWVRHDIDHNDGEYDEQDYPDGEYMLDEQPPFLAPPRRTTVLPQVERASTLLDAVLEPLKAAKPHTVLLLDSLDRLPDVKAFDVLVEQDIESLKKLGIGVVLVGPLRAMYGAHRLVVNERFQDNFYPQMAIDVTRDEQGQRFLMDVLRKRAGSEILPEAACRLLVESSGGVLRDLISLARAAGDEAFRRGGQRVEEMHVETAARAFGKRFLFGLRDHEIKTLLQLQKTGLFTGSSEDDLSLLTTQRILAYAAEDGGARYAIHPTLLPLLTQLQAAS